MRPPADGSARSNFARPVSVKRRPGGSRPSSPRPKPRPVSLANYSIKPIDPCELLELEATSHEISPRVLASSDRKSSCCARERGQTSGPGVRMSYESQLGWGHLKASRPAERNRSAPLAQLAGATSRGTCCSSCRGRAAELIATRERRTPKSNPFVGSEQERAGRAPDTCQHRRLRRRAIERVARPRTRLVVTQSIESEERQWLERAHGESRPGVRDWLVRFERPHSPLSAGSNKCLGPFVLCWRLSRCQVGGERRLRLNKCCRMTHSTSLGKFANSTKAAETLAEQLFRAQQAHNWKRRRRRRRPFGLCVSERLLSLAVGVEKPDRAGGWPA